MLEIHANILPVDLQFCKVQFRAASRICTLPKFHPLHSISRRTARHFVNSHKSTLHYLFYITRLKLGNIEAIQPVRRRPTYRPPFDTVIGESRESALLANSTNRELPIRIYGDGSGYKGGIGSPLSSARETKQNTRCIITLAPTPNTVYKGEVVGITLGFRLLHKLNRHLTETILIGLDNQATQLPASVSALRQRSNGTPEALGTPMENISALHTYAFYRQLHTIEEIPVSRKITLTSTSIHDHTTSHRPHWTQPMAIPYLTL